MTYNMALDENDHVKAMQLLSLVHELMHNYDNNIQSDLIQMDFAKAFDKVPHKRLLYKLQW